MMVYDADLFLRLHMQPTLQSQDLNGVAKFISSKQCKKISVLTGAGISVSAGIPNTINLDTFTGFYKHLLDIESRILSAELFKFNPSVYLECARDLILNTYDKDGANKYTPTPAHWFIKLLDDKEILKRCYTTNIDGLSLKTGLTTKENKLFPIHGTVANVECFACKRKLDEEEMDEFVAKIKNRDFLKQKIKCNYCIGNNLGPPHLKPSVVLFGEPISFTFFDLIHNKKDLDDVDLLIIMGTTLKVAPSNFIPVICREKNKKCVRLLINKENVDEFEEIFDFEDKNSNDVFLKGKCDDIAVELVQLLGWSDDFAKQHPNGIKENDDDEKTT
eukprot:110846_1